MGKEKSIRKCRRERRWGRRRQKKIMREKIRRGG